MQRKFLLVVAAFLLSCSLMAQPVQQKISEKVTVTFPGKPEEQKPQGDNGPQLYTFKKDTTLMYTALAMDLSSFGLTADMVSSMGDGLWDQMLGGITAQLAGATLVKNEKTTFKSKSALFLEINGDGSSKAELKGKKIFQYVFFLGSVMHQVAYASADKNATVADAKTFFDSVTIAQ